MAFYMQQNLIPGAVVQIQQNGKTWLRKAYGFAQVKDFEGNFIPNPPETDFNILYDLASLTKVVGTTTAIMLLHDRGKLNVEDPVWKFIPGFKTPDKESITIRHLLTHTSGIAEWYPMFYFCKNRKEVFSLIEQLPLKYPVGAARHYSDLGFTILGEIIEKVAGLPMEQFMKEQVFMPLGMKHTGYLPDKNQKFAATSMGNPYEYRMVHEPALGFTVEGLDPDSWNGWRQYVLIGEVNDGNAWYASQGVSGAAGIFSTIDDVQRLVNLLMNKGKVKKKPFISSKTIDLFLTQDQYLNGLGWMMDPDNSFMKNGPAGTFGHTGFTGTSISVVPKKKLSIIILINRQNEGLQANGTYFNPNPIRRGIFEFALEALEAK